MQVDPLIGLRHVLGGLLLTSPSTFNHRLPWSLVRGCMELSVEQPIQYMVQLNVAGWGLYKDAGFA